MVTAGVGRRSQQGVVTDGSTFWRDDLVLYEQELRLSGVVHGIAHQPTSLSECVLFQYLESDGTVQVTIALDATGHLKVYRGTTSGTLLATATDPLAVNTYYYLESRVFIDNTDGTVELRLWSSTTEMTTPLNFTGDTKNGGTGLISQISYGISGASSVGNWGDKYTCDLVGSSFNDFLGNRQITAFYPDGAGSSETWIPTPDVANWQNVATNPPDVSVFNESPDISLDTIPTLDLLALQGASLSTIDAVVENHAVRALPVVEIVDVSEPNVFGVPDPPDPPALAMTTTGNETKAGDLILVGLVALSNDLITVDPQQTGFTLLSHQRVDYDGAGTNFFHYMVYWALAATDGAVEYDFTEAADAFTYWVTFGVYGYVPNIVLRNQTGSWEFDLAEAAQDGFSCPMGDCPPNTLALAGTAAPDTYGHYNLVMGYSPYGGEFGTSPAYQIAPSFGHDYSVLDNGSSTSNNGVFSFGLRAVRGTPSPDLVVEINGTFGFNNGGAAAVSFDIKPRTSPPGVEDFLMGGTMKLGAGTGNSYGIVPSNSLRIYQFPFPLAPDDSAWSLVKFNALEGGYQSDFSVDVDPPPTPTLAVGSTNPVSGTTITISPDDNNGDDDGSTPFTREYNLETSVTLTAPATASGNPFSKWKKDGVDDAITETVSLAMDEDHQMQAIYTAASCPAGDSLLLLDGSTMPPQGDGTEITSWADEGIHAYAWVNYEAHSGPLYDTTPANNILYSSYNGGVGSVNRALRLNTPIDTDLGLSGAFTMIFVLLTEAGAPASLSLVNVNQLDNNAGWDVQLREFGGNFGISYRQYGNGNGTYLGSIDSALSYSLAASQKKVVSIVCDGINVRMLVNGQELAGKEWFNNTDSSSNYLSSNPTSASNAAIGSSANAFANPFYGQLPYLLIRDVNLSDADRQALESAQAAIYGISYTPGVCTVGCVA